MHIITYIIIVVLAVVLQVSFLPQVFGGSILIPSIVLMLSLSLALTVPTYEALAWIAFLGILFDMLSNAPLGLATIPLLLLATVASMIARKSLTKKKSTNFFILSSIVGATSILYILIIFTLEYFFISNGIPFYALQEIVLFIIINGALFFILYKLVYSVEKYLTDRESHYAFHK